MSDLHELLRSPLDDREPSKGYGALVMGALLGFVAVVVVGLFLVLDGDAESEPDAASVVSTSTRTTGSATSVTSVVSTTIANPVTRGGRFPEGYAAIGDDVAWKPSAIATTDNGFVVTMTSAVANDATAADVPRPLGGTFELVRTDGSTEAATRVITDRFYPGVYGVEFSGAPDPGDALRLVERWDPDSFMLVASTPYRDDAPFVMAEPLRLEVADQTTFVITALTLGRFSGSIEWSLGGPDGVLGIAGLSVLLVDDEGVEIGDYGSSGGSLDAAKAADGLQLFWGPSFPTDQTGATDVEISVRLQLGDRRPTEIFFPLQGVPVD